MSDDGVIDSKQLAHDIDALNTSQQRLITQLRSVSAVDPTRPTELPSWTVGHVLSHIARNADSTLRMLAGLPQYWKGMESRVADIELGAGRSWAELVDDVAATNDAVIRRVREIDDWSGTVQATTAVRPKAVVPQMRRREVEIHHIDLGVGYRFSDLPADFVGLESRRLTMLWQARQPMGLTSLPEAVLELPEHERLAWLCGRRTVDGVEPAGVF